MSLRKALHGLVVLAAVLITLPAKAQDIKIGALFPLSGTNAVYGEIFTQAVSLAVDHVNADRMLKGRLAIQAEDSQALPQAGVVGMNKLVNVEKVPFVLSAFTGVSKAIAPIGQRSKVVMVNGGGVGPDLAELGPYFWNVIPLANFEVRALAPYLVKSRGAKRVLLIYVDDPIGQAIRKELEAQLPPLGAALVEAMAVPVSAQQFGGIAARARDAKPDAIYIASYGTQQIQIVKQLRDNGLSQQLASYSAFSVADIQALPEAQGALYTTQKVDWTSQDPITKRFVDGYRAKYNKMPTAYVANYYNAVRIFALLAAELQKQGKPVTGENLLAQRLATKTFDVVGGRVSFEANGTLIAPMQVNEIANKSSRAVN